MNATLAVPIGNIIFIFYSFSICYDCPGSYDNRKGNNP